MAKEMIISSSAHEKKIAIIEDGIVAEYYVERSDESQGIVGNIYKGRVMKVLPGMQSAFVDIGLERDAFLYVSDFFEEDGADEFETLEVKTKEPTPEPDVLLEESLAEPQQEDLTEDTEDSEDLHDYSWTPDRPITGSTLSKIDTAKLQEPVDPPVEMIRVKDDDLQEATDASPGTSSIDNPSEPEPPKELQSEDPPPPTEETQNKKKRARSNKASSSRRRSKRTEEEQPNLERIVDELEDAGETLKDTSVQQQISDQSHEAEVSLPQPEPATNTPISQQNTSLERVVDEEPTQQKKELKEGYASFRMKLHMDFSTRRSSRRRGRRSGRFSSNPPEDSPSAAPEKTINGKSQPTISELLHEGQEILVQIAKEPIALKGARITSYIALPGRYLVYMPTITHIGVSRKIASDAERSRLRKLILSLREKEQVQGGFIVRTACEGHTEQELHDDMMYLVRTWQDIRKKAERTKAPALICRELDLVQRSLRDLLSDEFTAIRVDSETEYARIVDFVNRFQPKLVNRVKLYTKRKPIFEEYGVQEEIDKAIKPRVWLRSGGYIVINQTEALVAIDVNTGKFVGKSNRLEDTITKTNLEAVKEIVRQIRLRDLGGIIVLDLIDMEERKNRQKVMQALEAELKSDRSPSKVLQFNDFGLVAITRKRVRQSLERTLCSPCPYCEGSGLVKSPQTVCYEILAEARRISAEVELHPGMEVILRVNSAVADILRNSERKVLNEIEAYFGTTVTLKGDPSVHQERYDFAII
ncbi:MAG: Rne/Rng family ribonuclease [Acidobacteriota bacterium]|nr:Rne/Rng family ribonuclease [Blastocatellia bacterium]MDW8411405.1 Rne/Rng family ribonuclease [Acidobacteriota bacterium]